MEALPSHVRSNSPCPPFWEAFGKLPLRAAHLRCHASETGKSFIRETLALVYFNETPSRSRLPHRALKRQLCEQAMLMRICGLRQQKGRSTSLPGIAKGRARRKAISPTSCQILAALKSTTSMSNTVSSIWLPVLYWIILPGLNIYHSCMLQAHVVVIFVIILTVQQAWHVKPDASRRPKLTEPGLSLCWKNAWPQVRHC